MVDDTFNEPKVITRIEASQRAHVVHNLKYRIALSLLRGGENFHGHVTINFDLSYNGYSLNLDYKGREVRELIINGHVVTDKTVFREHKIYLPRSLLHLGHNQIKIRFVSAYVRDCQGVHYFKDPKDEQEYIYS